MYVEPDAPNSLFTSSQQYIEISDFNNGSNNKKINFYPHNKNGDVAIFKDGKLELQPCKNIVSEYNLGKRIYESLDKDILWILPSWDNIGDVFKIASLSAPHKKYHGVEKLGIIVRNRLKGIASLFDGIDYELNLKITEYNAIRTYVQYEMLYRSKVLYCAFSWPPFASLTGMTSQSYQLELFDELYDLSYESDRFKRLMFLPNNVEFTKINTHPTKMEKKILLNPFGGWVYTKFPSIRQSVFDLMEKLSIYFHDKGYEVYTNSNNQKFSFSNSKVITLSVCALANEVNRYSAIISICTGLTDMLALSESRLHVIYPNSEWATTFSRRALRNSPNLHEYILHDIDVLYHEIINQCENGLNT